MEIGVPVLSNEAVMNIERARVSSIGFNLPKLARYPEYEVTTRMRVSDAMLSDIFYDARSGGKSLSF